MIVIRFEGTKGGPGMREMLWPTAAFVGTGLSDKVALVTEVPWSHKRALYRACKHRGIDGGPIAVVKDGNIICIDTPNRRLDLKISAEELQERFKQWKPPKINVERECSLHALNPWTDK
ncbi:MAG: dihydroxy-acid dehydratase [Candidatus Bathyarchaeia archaeon]